MSTAKWINFFKKCLANKNYSKDKYYEKTYGYYIKALESDNELEYLRKAEDKDICFDSRDFLVELIWDKFVEHVKQGNIDKIEEHLNFIEYGPSFDYLTNKFSENPMKYEVEREGEWYQVMINGEKKSRFRFEEEHHGRKYYLGGDFKTFNFEQTIIVPVYNFGQLVINDLYPLIKNPCVSELNLDKRNVHTLLHKESHRVRINSLKIRLAGNCFGTESEKADMLFHLFFDEIVKGEINESIETHLHDINKEIVHVLLRQENPWGVYGYNIISPNSLYHIYKREGNNNFKKILDDLGEQKGGI